MISVTQIGKYRVDRELGRGGMGVVYKAFDPIVERTVAIKTIRLDVEKPEDLVGRLKREAKSVGQLEHPNIVTLYDAGESSGLFYLAMQFIHGETLEDRITRQRWFTLKETYEIFQQVCAGLDYAHQHGVVHRDIKPANIMITHEGVVKLTDFGIAKLMDTGASTSGVIVGTPSYMSPEQALGKPLDGRSDIFSLGSILYELITGEKSFPGQNVTTIIYKIVHEAPTPVNALQPGLDPALGAMVMKALAKRPEDRFQTCSELSSAIELYLSQSAASVPSTRVETPPPVTPPAPVASYPVSPTTPPPPAVSISTPPTGVSSVSGTGTSAGIPPVSGKTGVPFAWVGGGALGALLLVAIILLTVQMRRPAPVVTPQSVPMSNPAVGTPATEGLGANQPAAAPEAQGTTAPLPSVQSSQGQPPSAQSAPSTLTAPSASQTTDRPATANPHDISSSAVKTPHPAPTNPQTTSLPRPSAEAGVSHAEAQKHATPASPAEPETFDSLMLKGDLAFQEGNYENALNAYTAAYKMQPGSPQARRKIAVALTMLGRVEEAQKYK